MKQVGGWGRGSKIPEELQRAQGNFEGDGYTYCFDCVKRFITLYKFQNIYQNIHMQTLNI